MESEHENTTWLSRSTFWRRIRDGPLLGVSGRGCVTGRVSDLTVESAMILAESDGRESVGTDAMESYGRGNGADRLDIVSVGKTSDKGNFPPGIGVSPLRRVSSYRGSDVAATGLLRENRVPATRLAANTSNM